MRTVILAVVYNLRQEDFEEPHTRIEQIESAIKNAILSTSAFSSFKSPPNETCFSFPQDPTVTSYEVPVAIVVDLLMSTRDQQISKQRLSEAIANAFKSIRDEKNRLAYVNTLVMVSVKSPDLSLDGFCSLT